MMLRETKHKTGLGLGHEWYGRNSSSSYHIDGDGMTIIIIAKYLVLRSLSGSARSKNFKTLIRKRFQ